MKMTELTSQFCEAANVAGAEIHTPPGFEEAARLMTAGAGGPVLVPAFSSGERIEISRLLRESGCEVWDRGFRAQGAGAAAGVTGANFALARTGTLVLESTSEDIRLASTLPEKHFVLLDPRKILADHRAAVPQMQALNRRGPRGFVAWITGPSRTADIERVLTIGVHGPRELHILLVEGLSDDFMES